MMRLASPVWLSIIYLVALTVAIYALQSVFYQLASWASPMEAALEGKWDFCYAQMARLLLGHMLIDMFNALNESYTRRAEEEFGQQIHNGVIGSILSQDFEFFDKHSPGVLQERLNRDADQLGESLIKYPRRIFGKFTQVVLHLWLVYLQIPLDLFL